MHRQDAHLARHTMVSTDTNGQSNRRADFALMLTRMTIIRQVTAMATLQSTIVNTVLELARLVEPNMAAVITWYFHVPIAELGNLSARQLVEQGRTDAVVAFLKAICCGDRS
ncbi:hypothetical protein [Dyella choica]|uniref:DUF2384 domain-containing protein n=1 Tax=Dyella choica TaxID=1927959 RepID=A0A3S0RMR2_9GAMM|nr:hypothetical protein [Dyella choica]RUL78832.1 hypothetical protein EKH80_03220 [Dyella choica]